MTRRLFCNFLSSAGMMPQKLEQVVPLHQNYDQRLAHCGGLSLVPQSICFHRTTEYTEAFLFFTTWPAGIQIISLYLAIWFFRFALSSVRPGLFECALHAAMYWFRLSLESLFFSWAAIFLSAPQFFVPHARWVSCVTLSFSHRSCAVLWHNLRRMACKIVATGWPLIWNCCICVPGLHRRLQ